MAIGVLCALFAGVFRYIDSHFHSPEAFVENTTSLADNAEVRERIFEEFRAEIVSIADGVNLDEPDTTDPLAVDTSDEASDGTSDTTPDASGDDDDATDQDDADDSADSSDLGPVTDARIERDQAIEEILFDVLDSELYQQVMSDGLASVQTQVIRSAELQDAERLRDPGAIVLDARRLYQPIYERLAADPRTASITQNEVPSTYGIFPVADRETTVDAMWWGIENGPNWRGLTFAGAILALIGAVAVAERRPSRVIQFGAGIVGLALVVIVVVYIVRAVVPLLASGGDFAGAVSAVYAANIGPLVGIMVRLLVIGAVLAAVGGIAKAIWPDDWVYGQVADDRGVRSVRRRKGAPEPQAQQPQQRQVAAAAPVAYPYPQPYGYAPAPGWGQPYPGGYAPGYPPYPAGPYAQPAPGPGPYMGGQPTVPVVPVTVEGTPTGETPALNNGRTAAPADAAQAVPRVVAASEAPPAPAPAGARETAAAEPELSSVTAEHDDDQVAVAQTELETAAVPIVTFDDDPADQVDTNGQVTASADQVDDAWASDDEW